MVRIFALAAVSLAILAACRGAEEEIGSGQTPTSGHSAPSDAPSTPDPSAVMKTPTLRYCPECFLNLPTSQPGGPCPQIESARQVLPEYGDIPTADVSGWSRYESPHNEFSFSYPPDWKLKVTYNDTYNLATHGFVRGPISETIDIQDPDWQTYVNTGKQMGAGVTPGAARIEGSYGPIPVDPTCQSNSQGNPRALDSESIDSLPVEASILAREEENSVFYSLAYYLDMPNKTNLSLFLITWDDLGALATMKALVSSVKVSE